jgi:hypothetical protein
MGSDTAGYLLSHLLPLAICLIFVVLALWHFYMATKPSTGVSAAVPSVDGKPLFVPRRMPTVAVGLALLLCSALVGATGGLIPNWPSRRVLVVMCDALALGLLLRAIGEFRYVGFFKRVRNTPFSRLDSLLYSPLCLLLAAGVALVAYRSDYLR